MEKRTKWALIAVILAAVAIVCFLWLRKALDPFAKGPEAVVVPEFPYDQIRPGDLAFRTGTGLYSIMLNASTADTIHFSHIGLVAMVDSQLVVIHAVPNETEGPNDFDRVKMETLKAFFDPKRALHGELVHTGFAHPERMIDTAMGFVRDSVKFDTAFDLTDSSRLYCTEMIWLLYRREGIDLTEGRRTHCNAPGLGPEGCITVNDIYDYSGNESYFRY